MITPAVRRYLMPLALACALSPVAAMADARADFQTRYTELKTAMDTRDPARIKPLLTPDFVATDIAGRRQDADALIARLATIPVDSRGAEKTTVETVVLDGRTAKVVRRVESSGTREGPDGEEHAMALVASSADEWVQGGSGWLLKATVAQEMTITRDGQVVRHMKQGDPLPMGRGRGSTFGGEGKNTMGPPADGPT